MFLMHNEDLRIRFKKDFIGACYTLFGGDPDSALVYVLTLVINSLPSLSLFRRIENARYYSIWYKSGFLCLRWRYLVLDYISNDLKKKNMFFFSSVNISFGTPDNHLKPRSCHLILFFNLQSAYYQQTLNYKRLNVSHIL